MAENGGKWHEMAEMADDHDNDDDDDVEESNGIPLRQF